MEKNAVLTHWVADNIRYAGISMGKGEGYTLHDTKMNYTDRCGVCKRYSRNFGFFSAHGGVRGLSGHDDGGQSCRKYSCGSFQSLCSCGETC